MDASRKFWEPSSSHLVFGLFEIHPNHCEAFSGSISLNQVVLYVKAFIRKHDFKNKANCICTAFDPDNTLPRDEHGHIACKVSEANDEVKSILNISSKNIPEPSKMDLRNEVIPCITDYITQINSMLGPKEKRLGQHRAGRKRTGTCKNREFENLTRQMKVAGLNSTFIKEIKTQINTTLGKSIEKSNGSPTQKNLDETCLRALKAKYKHMIFSPLDKNGGCMHMCCPVAYTNAMKKTFRHDDNHYTQTNLNAERINQKYRHFYEEIGSTLSKVHCKKFEEIEVPYAYILFKNKDIKKIRPIVSYATHPLKRILNITCRALNHMIKTIDPNHALHCNMETCIELKERIKTFEKRNKKTYGKNTRFAFIMGDVKNMYTELQHATIQKAIKWIVTEYEKQTRRKAFTVKRRGKGGVHNGRATNTFSSTTITIDQILKIVDFDLKNAHFAVGDPGRIQNMYRQIIGVPMGSPLSPALAKITCMYFENIMLQRYKHEDICHIEGLRFMDDLLALGTFDYTSTASKRAMKKQIKELTVCYDERMSLEIEAESGIGDRNTNKETQYLQSNIIFNKNRIEMYENNKNAQSITEQGTQKLLRFPHMNSYAPTKQKIAICFQAAIAIERYSTTRKLKKRQFEILEKELRGPLEYPHNFIQITLNYMRRKTEGLHDHWKHIRAQLG